jgi:hypothetical protein
MTSYRLVVMSLLYCAGCGERLPVAPVSGRITFEGRPLAGAGITTQPIAQDTRNPGSGSFGLTDDQGRFELELVKPARKGAIIGEHRVMISKPAKPAAKGPSKVSAEGGLQVWEDDPRANRAVAGDNWPHRFSDGSLRLTVPQEGTDSADFDLTNKP